MSLSAYRRFVLKLKAKVDLIELVAGLLCVLLDKPLLQWKRERAIFGYYLIAITY